MKAKINFFQKTKLQSNCFAPKRAYYYGPNSEDNPPSRPIDEIVKQYQHLEKTDFEKYMKHLEEDGVMIRLTQEDSLKTMAEVVSFQWREGSPLRKDLDEADVKTNTPTNNV